jgi:hypothetical protein
MTSSAEERVGNFDVATGTLCVDGRTFGPGLGRKSFLKAFKAVARKESSFLEWKSDSLGIVLLRGQPFNVVVHFHKNEAAGATLEYRGPGPRGLSWEQVTAKQQAAHEAWLEGLFAETEMQPTALTWGSITAGCHPKDGIPLIELTYVHSKRR